VRRCLNLRVDFPLKESTLHLVLIPRYGMQIIVKTPPGKFIMLDVVATDTIDSVMANIRDKVGVPPAKTAIALHLVLRLRGGMQIFLRTAGLWTAPFRRMNC